MTQVVFRGIDLIQLIAQAKTRDSESRHDLTVSCTHVRDWLGNIFTQMPFLKLILFKLWLVLP